jgi:hypothetical protein
MPSDLRVCGQTKRAGAKIVPLGSDSLVTEVIGWWLTTVCDLPGSAGSDSQSAA